MAFLLVSLALLSAAASAYPGFGGGPPLHWPGNWPGHGYGDQVWDLKKLSAVVAFGDSYTDNGRLSYFSSHNGSSPPVGYTYPPSNASADGGYAWPVYVGWYTGAEIHDYAISGAVCSNDITPRFYAGIDADFPAVEQYEVPAYLADSQYVEPDGVRFLSAPQDETVYSIWIGTNDLGVWAFLTDSQVRGTNITSYIDCVFDQLQRVYDNGGRYFVLQNVLPLQLTPLYATPENGGVGPNHYWPNKPSNITAISYKMLEEVVTTNAIYEYRTPFEVVLTRKFPGARFALMDMYGLISDIYNNPTEYLNGTAPANVTGFINHCDITGATCVQESSPDSFLWFDELHPSQQTDRIIARAYVDVVKGRSKWATYWSS